MSLASPPSLVARSSNFLMSAKVWKLTQSSETKGMNRYRTGKILSVDGKETSRIWEESGLSKGELSTEHVVDTGRRRMGPERVCLSVVSHEADPGQALVCGTDRFS